MENVNFLVQTKVDLNVHFVHYKMHMALILLGQHLIGPTEVLYENLFRSKMLKA